jgi:outer membrane protein assembly factor BamB
VLQTSIDKFLHSPLPSLRKATKAVSFPRFFKVMSTISFSLVILFAIAGDIFADNWPMWRGPLGTGIANEKQLPTRWDLETNVKWKTPLPERGNSTPVIWEKRVFLTQSKANQRLVLCLNRADGSVLWEMGTDYAGPEKFHPTNTPCAASPATDGEIVVANFGSAGIFAFDFEGRKLWQADLGTVTHQWGYAASPVLDGERCYIHFGPGTNHMVVALEKRSGKKLWHVNVPIEHPSERTDGFAGKQGEVGSWSTPILVQANQRTELVVSLPGRLAAFDLKNGEELWRCGGLNPLLYTSAMAGEGVVIGSGGYGGSTVAVRPGGVGDVTEKRLWHKLRDKQRIGSGVIAKGHLFILNTPGTAQCISLKTGDTVWEQRLSGSGSRSESWSSMILSNDLIYVNNQAGDVFILRAAPEFELIATNSIQDGIMNASVAASDGEIFLRTEKHLWCIR